MNDKAEAAEVKLIRDAAGWTGSIVTLPFDKTPAHLRLPGNFGQHAMCSSRRIRELLAIGRSSLGPKYCDEP